MTTLARLLSVALPVGLAVQFAAAADIPRETSLTYVLADGRTNVCLVQAPTNPAADAAILLYMHGARHDETQGMTLFPILRQLLADKGWIYVSPREYEYDRLRAELAARYGSGRKIFLAGASAGARASLAEVRRTSGKYAGLFLIGPALRDDPPRPGEVTIPTFLIYGDEDGGLTDSARDVASALRGQRVRVKEIVIPGEGHEAPYGRQNWWYDALPFVTGETFPRPAR